MQPGEALPDAIKDVVIVRLCNCNQIIFGNDNN